MRRRLARTDVDQAQLEVKHCVQGGIITSDIFRRVDEVIDLLNGNQKLLWNIRQK